MNEETIILTRYIAAWGWHIIGIMFFIQAVTFLIENNYIWMIGFVGVTIFSEIFAYIRKSEVERMVVKDNNEETQ